MYNSYSEIGGKAMKIEELISTLRGYNSAGFEEIEFCLSHDGWTADCRTKTINMGKTPGYYTIDGAGTRKEVSLDCLDYINK